MSLNDRRFNFQQIIENTLSESFISKDIFLCSRLAFGDGYIPIYELANHKSIRALNLPETDILRYCKNIRKIQVFDEEQIIPSVFPGFKINPYNLICHGIHSKNKEEFLKFVQFLCGETNGINVEINDKKEICVLNFKDRQQCFAFWRALQYVPFQEKFIEAEMLVGQFQQQMQKNQQRKQNKNQKPKNYKNNSVKKPKPRGNKNVKKPRGNKNQSNEQSQAKFDNDFPPLKKK